MFKTTRFQEKENDLVAFGLFQQSGVINEKLYNQATQDLQNMLPEVSESMKTLLNAHRNGAKSPDYNRSYEQNKQSLLLESDWNQVNGFLSRMNIYVSQLTKLDLSSLIKTITEAKNNYNRHFESYIKNALAWQEARDKKEECKNRGLNNYGYNEEVVRTERCMTEAKKEIDQLLIKFIQTLSEADITIRTANATELLVLSMHAAVAAYKITPPQIKEQKNYKCTIL